MLAALAVITIAATPSQAQEKSTWEAIKERGSLRVGVVNTAPWFIKNPSTKEWSGLGTTIGKAMAEALGVKAELVEVKWGTSIPALQANKIDIMYFLDPTPERAKAVDFPPVAVVDIALGVLVDDAVAVDKWADLNKADISVAVPQGTSMDRFVSRNLTKATILRFPSNQESVAAFQSGRANVASMFLPPLILLQQKVGRGKIVVPKPVHASSASAAIRAEPDKRFRDWAGTAIFYWYHTGQIQLWFTETLKEMGLDPTVIPGVKRSDW
jgi:polar amino acid transport system substrate-binding protein